jgi:hypothetical protein
VPASLACIPDWRADETLYSWVAGFHVTYGNGSANDTAQLLFGTRHASKERDAPNDLHYFVKKTRGELGNVRSVLLTRTPIGLFAPFLPASRQQALADRILGVGGTKPVLPRTRAPGAGRAGVCRTNWSVPGFASTTGAC